MRWDEKFHILLCTPLVIQEQSVPPRPEGPEEQLMTSEGDHHVSSYICWHRFEELRGLMEKGAAGPFPLRLQLKAS